MATYKYVSNKAPTDGTSEIILSVDENGKAKDVLSKGGTAVLTDSQYSKLKNLFNIEKVSENQQNVKPESSVKAPSVKSNKFGFSESKVAESDSDSSETT